MDQHWNKVYTEKVDNVSWFEERPELSLQELKESLTDEKFSLIDVGSGASRFVDNILSTYKDSKVTLLDISKESLNFVKKRLSNTDRVEYICDSIVTHEFEKESFDFWHDRAVFHFLTDEKDRKRYVESCQKALKKNGTLIIMTFQDPDGTNQCSGLPIKKYSKDSIQKEITELELVSFKEFVHKTPSGNSQKFIACRFKKN